MSSAQNIQALSALLSNQQEDDDENLQVRLILLQKEAVEDNMLKQVLVFIEY